MATKEKIKFNGDFLIIDAALDKLINSEITGIEISNIVSSDFCEHYGINYIDDFNGWQCDWWAYTEFNGTGISIGGCAWYGTIGLSIE